MVSILYLTSHLTPALVLSIKFSLANFLRRQLRQLTVTEAALLCVNNRVLMFTGENAGLAISAWRSRMLPTLHTTQWSSKILTNIYVRSNLGWKIGGEVGLVSLQRNYYLNLLWTLFWHFGTLVVMQKFAGLTCTCNGGIHHIKVNFRDHNGMETTTTFTVGHLPWHPWPPDKTCCNLPLLLVCLNTVA